LRGLGTVMALPVFESMLPSMRLMGATAGASSTGFPRRLAWVYIPNGANMPDWIPATTGRDYELSKILQPLQAHKNDITVISGLDNFQANELGDGGGGHARASAAYLTGVHPRKTAGADIRGGISADQIAAEAIGDQTKVPSMELSCDAGQRNDTCDSGYSCAYQFNISWKSPTMPVNPEVDPKSAFERLFGGADAAQTLEAQAKRRLYNKSVLDYVLDDSKHLNSTLGTSDQRKLDEYLSAVRDLEKRIAASEKFKLELPPEMRPAGLDSDPNFEGHMRLMYDIMTLAFQTDATRIATFIVGHDGSNRPYPQTGILEGHHDISHHRNNPAQRAKMAVINQYHVENFAYFLQKLKSVKEGDGTLLDNCAILYGGGLGEPNTHTPENLPIVLAGRAGGAFTSGQHLYTGGHVPITNLYRSMLDTVGAKTEKIGDSNGELDLILQS
jgi:hypothetical protein